MAVTARLGPLCFGERDRSVRVLGLSPFFRGGISAVRVFLIFYFYEVHFEAARYFASE